MTSISFRTEAVETEGSEQNPTRRLLALLRYSPVAETGQILTNSPIRHC